MSNHTPGPWTFAGNSVQPAPAGPIIARIDPRRESSEVDANGTLIAAAPELLEALQKQLIIGNPLEEKITNARKVRDLLERLGVEVVE